MGIDSPWTQTELTKTNPKFGSTALKHSGNRLTQIDSTKTNRQTNRYRSQKDEALTPTLSTNKEVHSQKRKKNTNKIYLPQQKSTNRTWLTQQKNTNQTWLTQSKE